MGAVATPDVGDSARSPAAAAALEDVERDVVDLQVSDHVDVPELGKEPRVRVWSVKSL